MATPKKPAISRESVERAKPFLISALKKMTAPMVTKIINASFPIDEIIDNQMTLLMLACTFARDDILPLILSKGPDLELRDSARRCSLHYACENGDEANFVNLMAYHRE